MVTAKEIFADIERATKLLGPTPKPKLFIVQAAIKESVVFSSKWTGIVSFEESQLRHFEQHYNNAHITFRQPEEVIDWVDDIKGQKHHQGLEFSFLVMDMPDLSFKHFNLHT